MVNCMAGRGLVLGDSKQQDRKQLCSKCSRKSIMLVSLRANALIVCSSKLLKFWKVATQLRFVTKPKSLRMEKFSCHVSILHCSA